MVKKAFAVLSLIFSFTTSFNFASQSTAVKMEDDGYASALKPMSQEFLGIEDETHNALPQFAVQQHAIAAYAATQAQSQKKEVVEPWHSLPMPQVPSNILGATAAAQYNQPTASALAAVTLATSPLRCSKGCNAVFSTQQTLQQHIAAHQRQIAVLVHLAPANAKTSAEIVLRRSQRQKKKKEYSDYEDNESESSESEDDCSDDGDSDATVYGEGEEEDGDSSSMEVVAPQKKTKSNQKAKTHPCSWKGCKKSFPKPSALKRHFRTHTGERPFACTWEGCVQSFAEMGNLKRHIRVHTGEKPYPCTKCADKFARLEHLQQHLKSKH
jgi:hypothetical protein